MIQAKPIARSFIAVPDGRELPEMVVIPPGSFWMGADQDGDKFASAVERPLHRVEIGYQFAVSRFPITFADWDLFLEAMPDEHRPSNCGWGRGRLPVINVSWNDAVRYTHWLSQKTGRDYRLLSEAEWEYCCRATTNSLFNTGSHLSVDQANFLYTDFRERPGVGRPIPVGSYPPNAFGLFDMHGNVCELVADGWHDNYDGAPVDGSAWENGGSSNWCVVRGGGWDAMPRILRSAFRDWMRRDQRMDNVGFRVACRI